MFGRVKDDKNQILVSRSRRSNSIIAVVKIEAPMYVYLDTMEDVKLQVGNYYMFQSEEIYLIKAKDNFFGFKAVSIESGDTLFIRNADEKEFAHVIKIRADKLRLQLIVSPRVNGVTSSPLPNLICQPI